MADDVRFVRVNRALCELRRLGVCESHLERLMRECIDAQVIGITDEHGAVSEVPLAAFARVARDSLGRVRVEPAALN